jgi:type VI secretion system protein ImpK
MKVALQEVAREAGAALYDPGEIREAEFAVVAFLDEAILSSKEPKAEDWRKKTLNVELFGQAIAGNVFFDKLNDVEHRRDSLHLADLLEVYLLCLLLGFEGRYAPPLKSEAHRIIDRLRGRIESIRGISYKLSPPLEFSAEPAPVPKGVPWPLWIAGALAAAIVLFVLYKLHLSWQVDQIEATLRDLR